MTSELAIVALVRKVQLSIRCLLFGHRHFFRWRAFICWSFHCAGIANGSLKLRKLLADHTASDRTNWGKLRKGRWIVVIVSSTALQKTLPLCYFFKVICNLVVTRIPRNRLWQSCVVLVRIKYHSSSRGIEDDFDELLSTMSCCCINQDAQHMG